MFVSKSGLSANALIQLIGITELVVSSAQIRGEALFAGVDKSGYVRNMYISVRLCMFPPVHLRVCVCVYVHNIYVSVCVEY